MLLTIVANFMTSVLMYTQISENVLSELFNGYLVKIQKINNNLCRLEVFNAISFTRSIQH